MIQRFQSLYLLVAALLFAVMTFRPLATVAQPGVEELQTVGAFDLPGVGIGAVVIAALNLIAIFLYSNRKRQILVVRLLLVISALFTGLVFAGHYQYEQGLEEGAVYSYAFVTFLPAVALILQFLALVRIRKDERLVRSMDRLR